LNFLLSPLSRLFERSLPDPSQPPVRNTRSAGRWVLGLLAVFALWAAFAPLSKGVVAPGTVVVDSKRKTIQHLEGGVIRAIHVKDGTKVASDALLLELDDTAARSTRDMVRARYLSKQATLDRLNALISGLPSVKFSPELTAHAAPVSSVGASVGIAAPEAADLMRLHNNLFQILRQEHEGKTSIARQRIGQIEQKLLGLESYRQSTQRQIDVIEKEVTRLSSLLDKKLIESAVVAERMQQLSQQQGELGKTVASLAETRISLGEARLGVIQVEKEWQQDLAKQIAEARESFIELRSQLEAAQNVLNRTAIKAPIAGTVLGLKATTVGGVLTPGTPIMDVVPMGDTLVIDAHVRPLDVDTIHVGMEAHVKFTSFQAKTTPELLGVVEQISADVLTDQVKSEPFYLMRVTVAGSELEKLHSQEILPGMPAEVYANAGSRTLFQYLTEPLFGVVKKSLRED